jgi:hypothetical protein
MGGGFKESGVAGGVIGLAKSLLPTLKASDKKSALFRPQDTSTGDGWGWWGKMDIDFSGGQGAGRQKSTEFCCRAGEREREAKAVSPHESVQQT